VRLPSGLGDGLDDKHVRQTDHEHLHHHACSIDDVIGVHRDVIGVYSDVITPDMTLKRKMTQFGQATLMTSL